MKLPKYLIFGELHEAYIKRNYAVIVVDKVENKPKSERGQTTYPINSKELRELADYLDKAKIIKKVVLG